MSRGYNEQELRQQGIQVFYYPQSDTRMHTHHFLELVYVVSGRVEHAMGDAVSTLHGGEYFVVDYGVAHGYRQLDGRPCKIINCVFLPELIDPALEGCRSIRTILNNYIIRLFPEQLPDAPTAGVFQDDGTVLSLLEEMIQETDEQQLGSREMVRCNLIKILVMTLRVLCIPQRDTAQLSHRIIRRLEKDCIHVPTLSQLAKEMHFSVSTLSNRFREETGKGYTAYLQQVRMKKACRLLTENKKTVAEVATECGYQDMKTFYAVFKQHMGVSPGRYRRQNCQR